MNKKSIFFIILAVVIIALLATAFFIFKKKTPSPNDVTQKPIKQVTEKDLKGKQTNFQKELEQLSSKMITEIKSEQRLNMTMFAQLRAYREMLESLQSYAKKLEKDLSIYDEISKNEFQEDVTLQAELFKGKNQN